MGEYADDTLDYALDFMLDHLDCGTECDICYNDDNLYIKPGNMKPRRKITPPRLRDWTIADIRRA